MFTYEQLTSWRDLCEWLNGRWYKFAYIHSIERAIALGELKILPFVYTASGRQERRILFNLYNIQFCTYKLHPVTNYRSRRSLRDEFDKDIFSRHGWCLVSDWEFKIDCLEQIVLFNREPDITNQPWNLRLQERLQQRKERQIAIEREEKLRQLEPFARYDAGYCPHCMKKLVPLMVDCPNCQLSYL